jgi:glutathione S-transferase
LSFFSVRFLLEYLGLPFEDKRYAERSEWFEKDKPALATNPLVNLPYLKDGDHVLLIFF